MTRDHSPPASPTPSNLRDRVALIEGSEHDSMQEGWLSFGQRLQMAQQTAAADPAQQPALITQLRQLTAQQDQAAQALAFLQEKHQLGKIVITA